jgi:hypothetical protein
MRSGGATTKTISVSTQSFEIITPMRATSVRKSRATDVTVMLSTSRMPVTFWLIWAAR